MTGVRVELRPLSLNGCLRSEGRSLNRLVALFLYFGSVLLVCDSCSCHAENILVINYVDLATDIGGL